MTVTPRALGHTGRDGCASEEWSTGRRRDRGARGPAGRRRALARRADVRARVRRWTLGARRGRGGGRAVPARERTQHPGVPVARVGSSPTRSGGRRACSTATTTSPGSSRAVGPNRSCVASSPPASGRAPNAASPNRRSCSPSRRTPRSTRRRTTSASPSRKAPVRADWTADVEAMAGARRPEHGARRRIGAAVPAGRAGRHPGDRRAGVVGRRQLPRRRVHGWLRPAVRRDARPRGGAVGLPRRRCHHDLRRHPQARLRPEGRVGHPAPHEGVAALPDVPVRRLARRLLRLAEHAGHPVGPADGVRLGGDVAPRHRRLRRADPADARQRRPDARRRSPRSTASGCSATAPST